LKLATWNVNSLKVRLPQVLAWLAEQRPDVLCVQETKLEDSQFPLAEIEAAGYGALYAGQRTYNGVALLSREPGADVQREIPGFEDEQRRLIAATIDDTRVICAYMPNGQAVGSDKYAYKLKWLAALKEYLREELSRHPKLVLLGDFNIAPEDRDVHDPRAWQGQVLVSEPERAAFREFLALGLVDGFRLFDQPEKSFTWWDYRQGAFRRNMGLRIDHILLSPALTAHARAARIDKLPRKDERPSDHAPVIVEIA
jgi:exodeoxyribonuclease III